MPECKSPFSSLRIWISAILLTLTFAGCARKVPLDDHGVPLIKDIYAKEFLIGTALDYRRPADFNPRELEIIKSHFSVITPENSMKPASLHPAEESWNWTAPDYLVNFCQENNIQIVGHTLVWHAQTGNWFFRDEDGKPVTREAAIERLRTHIHTVVGRYKGKIKGWDVVNEAINDSDKADSENLRPSPWLRAIGPDYITLAFKFAHEADPQAELYYNDYNIERGAKHQSSLRLLKRLISEGVPITAVGIQGHWSLTYLPYKDLEQAIRNYKALGLKVNITELDVTIAGQGGGQLNPAGTRPTTFPFRNRPQTTDTQPAVTTAPATGPATAPATGPATTGPATTAPTTRFGRGRGFGFNFNRPQAPPTPQQLKAQADAYAKFFRIFEKNKDVIDRVTFWGLNDRRSWRPGQSPLLFDNDNNPKPAIRAIAAEKRWGW